MCTCVGVGARARACVYVYVCMCVRVCVCIFCLSVCLSDFVVEQGLIKLFNIGMMCAVRDPSPTQVLSLTLEPNYSYILLALLAQRALKQIPHSYSSHLILIQASPVR